MYGFIVGKRKKRRAIFKLVSGVFICLFLSILGFLESIGFGGFSVSAETPDLVINEVFCNTPGTDSEEEWVELYNNSDSAVDISGFKIGDEEAKGGGEGMFEFLEGSSIEANSFLIVALKSSGYEALYGQKPDFEVTDTDSEVPDLSKYTSWAKGQIALNNSGDEVLLLDQSDSIVDQTSFGPCTVGESWERVPFGIGGFEKQENPTPGSGVESVDSNGDDAEDGDADEETSDEEETAETELEVSFSAPSEVTLGEEIKVEVSLENVVSGRSYLVKFGANDGTLDYGQFSKGYTWSDSLDKLLPFSGGAYRWDEFPSIGSGGGTIKARITISALAGDCAVMVRVRDAEENENYDSEVKMIRANEAPEEVVEEDDDDESGDANESDDSEEESGEVLGEQATTKRSAKKTYSSKSYAFGPFGKDIHQATASPILSASSSADHEATPSSESAFSTPSGEEGSSKFSIISKILLALGGFTILGVLSFSIAKKRGLV